MERASCPPFSGRFGGSLFFVINANSTVNVLLGISEDDPFVESRKHFGEASGGRLLRLQAQGRLSTLVCEKKKMKERLALLFVTSKKRCQSEGEGERRRKRRLRLEECFLAAPRKIFRFKILGVILGFFLVVVVGLIRICISTRRSARRSTNGQSMIHPG